MLGVNISKAKVMFDRIFQTTSSRDIKMSAALPLVQFNRTNFDIWTTVHAIFLYTTALVMVLLFNDAAY